MAPPGFAVAVMPGKGGAACSAGSAGRSEGQALEERDAPTPSARLKKEMHLCCTPDASETIGMPISLNRISLAHLPLGSTGSQALAFLLAKYWRPESGSVPTKNVKNLLRLSSTW